MQNRKLFEDENQPGPLVTATPAPTISVVMSVYNGQACVRRSIESILGQTWADFELIIVDDGSDDDTAGVLATCAAGDDRIRIVRQENQGLTRALIRGCSEARANFLARQDADDVSRPRRLQFQLELLQSDPSIGFVSCATQYLGPADEPLEVIRRPLDSAAATRQLLEQRQGPPAHGSVMFRKSLYQQVGGYRPEFYFGQDSDLWLRMAERSRIAYVADVLYCWRRDLGSVTGSRRSLQRKFGELGHACRQARLSGASEQPFLDEAMLLHERIRSGWRPPGGGNDSLGTLYLIGSQLVRNRDPRAARYLWNVVRRQPWQWKAWIRLAQSGLSARAHKTRQVQEV